MPSVEAELRDRVASLISRTNGHAPRHFHTKIVYAGCSCFFMSCTTLGSCHDVESLTTSTLYTGDRLTESKHDECPTCSRARNERLANPFATEMDSRSDFPSDCSDRSPIDTNETVSATAADREDTYRLIPLFPDDEPEADASDFSATSSAASSDSPLPETQHAARDDLSDYPLPETQHAAADDVLEAFANSLEFELINECDDEDEELEMNSNIPLQALFDPFVGSSRGPDPELSSLATLLMGVDGEETYELVNDDDEMDLDEESDSEE